jgi:hypothetical protein
MKSVKNNLKKTIKIMALANELTSEYALFLLNIYQIISVIEAIKLLLEKFV